MTNDPINLREGSVNESAVDLELPGPVFTWKLSRSFRSQTPNFSTSLGVHWFDGMADMRIKDAGAEFYVPYAPPFGNIPSSGDDGSLNPEYELRFNARSIVPLTATTTVSGVTTYAVPSDWPITVVDDTNSSKHHFIVREKYSDKIYIFHDFNTAKEDHLRGRLDEITTRQWYDASPRTPGYRFSYASDGRLIQIIPPPPQDGIRIVYKYEGVLTDKISSVQVWNGSESTGTLLMRADYLYWDDVTSPASDLGDSGMLVQVKISKRSSNDNDNNISNARYTQYRYEVGGHYTYLADEFGVLRSVYNHDAIQQIVNDSTEASTPEEVLTLAETGGTLELRPYASRRFEYYDGGPSLEEPDYTSNTDTPWEENENLETKYGGANYSETHELRVKAEYIGRGIGCTSCSGSSAAGITRQYHYMHVWPNGGAESPYYQWWIWHHGQNPIPRDINETRMLVVEDTLVHDDSDNYPDGRPIYRKIYALNDFSRKLREVLIEDPREENLRCWCWAWTYMKADTNGDGQFSYDSNIPDGDFLDANDDHPHLKHRLAEYRLPSAYNVTTETTLKDFLNPYHRYRSNNTDDWSNDEDVLRTNDGLIYVYEYNDRGLRTGERVKKGRTGDANYLSALDWGADAPGGSTNNQPQERIIASYVYPVPTTTLTDASRIQTKYNYEFWDTADTQLKRRSTLVPAVVTGENGPASGSSDPDNATVSAREEYYDKSGRLRWTQDGEGNVNYYSYHPQTGNLAYTAIDVNPTSLPTSADASANATYWVPSTAGDAHNNKPTRGSGLPNPLALVTTIRFDTLGREIQRFDPNNYSHITCYEADGDLTRLIQFPYWDGNDNEFINPIVTERDAMDRVIAVGTYNADNFAAGPTEGLGLGAPMDSSSCDTLTRYIYDDEDGRLSEVRRYHDTTDDEEFDNYYSTRYLYDAEGRVGATIEDVAPDKYQFTVTIYDVLGRPIEARRGVSSNYGQLYRDLVGLLEDAPAGFDGNGYGLATISKTIYDDTDDDGDSDIGDSHVSKSIRVNTSDANGETVKYTTTVYHRTFRGDVRGIEERFFNGTSQSDLTPYVALDIDNLGRTIASAKYTSEPTWSTLEGSYGAYVNHSSGATGRNFLNVVLHNVLGHVYRTRQYPEAINDSCAVNGPVPGSAEQF